MTGSVKKAGERDHGGVRSMPSPSSHWHLAGNRSWVTGLGHFQGRKMSAPFGSVFEQMTEVYWGN